jgi:uncharacterized protein (DUF342 family)
MSQKNSYFNLIIEDNKIKLKVYPPVEGGELLKLDDVTGYLQRNRIEEYDLKAINSVIHAVEVSEAVISNSKSYPINEYMEITVTPDRMFAVVRFFAPSNNGKRLSIDEIKSDLRNAKIINGVDLTYVERHVADPHYMTQMVVAKGEKPVNGEDARIEYMFNTDRKAKPQLNQDGTVDFHKLNNISHVKEGDVLAVLHKEDPGKMGKDVYGVEVRPRKVNKLALRYGNNINISEDGTTLYSSVDGHATLDGDRVSVSNMYTVHADVDNSTGDIEYNGSISVLGNVRTGFKIRAKGSIEIFGVVEGAIIIADGDIVLHRGIQGMGRCQVVAGGNLISKFIESANVAVNGYVETDTILHSQVAAKGDIIVRGKSGNIIGGSVRSTTLVEATCIGSPMGTTTCVEVGNDPAIMDKVNQIKKDITDKGKEKDNLTQSVVLLKKKLELGKADALKMLEMQKTAKRILELEDEINHLSDEYDKYSRALSENTNAKISARNTMYQGCKITISGDYILVHDSVSHCSYKKVNNEIKSVPL